MLHERGTAVAVLQSFIPRRLASPSPPLGRHTCTWSWSQTHQNTRRLDHRTGALDHDVSVASLHHPNQSRTPFFLSLSTRVELSCYRCFFFFRVCHSMQNESGTTYRPSGIKGAIDDLTSRFRGSDQHDSQELLQGNIPVSVRSFVRSVHLARVCVDCIIVALLDGMHDELNQRAPASLPTSITPVSTSIDPDDIVDIHQRAAFVWNKFLSENDSVISQLLYGMFQNTVTCTSCGFTSVSYNVSSQLTLDIPVTKV